MFLLLLRQKKIVDFVLNKIAHICLFLKIDKIFSFFLKIIKKLVKIFIKILISFYNFSKKIFNKLFIFKPLIKYIYILLNNNPLFIYIIKKLNSFNIFEGIISNDICIKNTYNFDVITEKFIEKLNISLIYFLLYISFKNVINFHISKEISINNNINHYISKLIPKKPAFSISAFSLLIFYLVLIQIFVLRDYLEISIILKYNILITLIIFLSFYGLAHTIQSFFENRSDSFLKNAIILDKYGIAKINFSLYICIYWFFIVFLFYCYIKSITIKEYEHFYKKKNIFFYISSSLYLWIKYGIRVKKKRDRIKN